jgi:hypothetical protein
VESSQQCGELPAAYEPPWIDIGVADPARIYDAWLGGKDNFAPDRIAAQAGLDAFPAAAASVRSNRAFLGRVVTHLAGEAGIRQFLDIGAGLPSDDNVLEIAQGVAPESRVACVDNDPVVLLHSQAMLDSAEQGSAGYIDADLRDPGTVLREAARVLDFSQPVAILLLGILHSIQPEEGPHELVRVLGEAVPAGSYLAISHLAQDIYPQQVAAFVAAVGAHVREPAVPRDHAEVTRFFGGFRLLAPGVVPTSKWRPRDRAQSDAPSALWAGLAVKEPGR